MYLLSREEVTNWNYGFNTVEDRFGGIVSDYSRANGCYIDVESGHYGEGPWWWFRSPYYDGSTLAQCVYKQGKLEVGNIDDYKFSVRPVLPVAI